VFDIAPTEMLVCAIVALVVIGPKDLPKALRVVGQWVAKIRGYARHFRSGVDAMIRESEIADLEKQWSDQNAKIMADYPIAVVPDDSEPTSAPAPDAPQMEPLPPQKTTSATHKKSRAPRAAAAAKTKAPSKPPSKPKVKI
jgi:sec-independent protein translocase protein TatB